MELRTIGKNRMSCSVLGRFQKVVVLFMDCGSFLRLGNHSNHIDKKGLSSMTPGLDECECVELWANVKRLLTCILIQMLMDILRYDFSPCGFNFPRSSSLRPCIRCNGKPEASILHKIGIYDLTSLIWQIPQHIHNSDNPSTQLHFRS